MLVEVHSAANGAAETLDAFAASLFTEINKAEPVQLVDLPDKADAAEKQILEDAAQVLALDFPTMFKPSTRCRAPHINVDVLRDKCFRANVVERYEIQSAAELVAWLRARNDECAAKDEAFWLAKRGRRSEQATRNALTKAKSHSMYLGLGWEWLRAP